MFYLCGVSLLIVVTEGVDYTSPQLEDVSLDDNLRRNCVSFIILDDDIYEGTEFFTVSLSGPSAPLLTISPNEYRINIVDNDSESCATT